MLLFQTVFTQNDSLKVNKKRVLVIGSSLALTIAGSYWYIQNSWWSERQIPFHFDDGSDLTYALNVDKFGHFMGGLETADIFASSMQWAGMNEKQSIWYGAIFGSGLQLAIETKDAYAPYWGFSKWDLALGSAGAFWPVAQYYNSALKAISFKFSYYPHSDIYWQLEQQREKKINKYLWQDDYPNQTYWVSFNINDVTKTSFLPDWLNVAVGFGLDDNQYLNQTSTKSGGNNEWYIALDYDIPKIFKKWDSPIGRTIKHWLNYLHFPAPTIRISPKLEFYPLFI
jgi:hypothetical protein